MRNPNLLLKDIIDAAHEIISYTSGVSKEDFVREPMRYNATIRMISVIGEAISQLEDNLKDNYPRIPWQQIKSMRNAVVYEYWQTDLEQVFLSSTQEVPELIRLISSILHDLSRAELAEGEAQEDKRNS